MASHLGLNLGSNKMPNTSNGLSAPNREQAGAGPSNESQEGPHVIMGNSNGFANHNPPNAIRPPLPPPHLPLPPSGAMPNTNIPPSSSNTSGLGATSRSSGTRSSSRSSRHKSDKKSSNSGSTPRSKSSSSSGSGLRPKACRFCGQPHSYHEPHLYNYKDEVDEDMTCQICLQPFVEPLDTPCGHTFCRACLLSYLKVNPMCPLDRKPLNEMVCQPSNLVLKRLLDKQIVTCPNSDSCTDELQRGNLDDHLKYRCSGTLVACQYAGAGCDFRGPKKAMTKHHGDCQFKKQGITRLPVLEGEVSHVEIPRTNSSLGITIVGGADTPLRCVVVQEVYPDGLIASDGRLQPGDQIIEINGIDMTCAPHAQVCTALRKMTSVLRLGVYRERIEKYGAGGCRRQMAQPQQEPNASEFNGVARTTFPVEKSNNNANFQDSKNENGIVARDDTSKTHPSSSTSPENQGSHRAQPAVVEQIAKSGRVPKQEFSTELHLNGTDDIDGELVATVSLERQTGKQLGIRLSGADTSEPTAGIFIADIQEGSTTQIDGRLKKFDRILFINGRDVRNAKLSQASALIQNNDKVTLVIARNKAAMVSNLSYKDKRHLVHSPTSEDRADKNGHGIDSSKTNGSHEHAHNGYSEGDSESLTIAHSRSKSAPAINQAGIRLRKRTGEKGRANDGEEDDDDDYDDCDDSDAEEVYKKITEGSQHAQPEQPHKIRPQFARNNVNGDNKISPKERSKTPVHLYSTRDKNHHQHNHYQSVENVVERESNHNSKKVNHVYDVPEGEDYMAIYETIDRKRQEAREMKNKSHSMEALETPNASIKGDDDQSSHFDFNINETSKKDSYKPSDALSSSRRRHRSKPHESNKSNVKSTSNSFHQNEHKRWSIHERAIPSSESSNAYPQQANRKVSSTANGQSISTNGSAQPNAHQIIRSNATNPDISNDVTDGSMASFLKRALRMEGPQLCQRTVTIKKTVRESLGMRIGGGIGSNEGDTPIYIANIHPHGCIGKSKNLKKGDLLLSVDDTSLCGLTHSQAVTTLKATINNDQVILGVMDGPETSFGASNFIPSWMYWQKLPRNLQYPKTVILHRRENASWGFSIVGGSSDSNSHRTTEPIHVLFVVPESPAAKDARLKCGDRLLAVDGQTLENIPHHMAVKMLKQTSTRVVLEVVSWMGTEL